MKFSIRSFIRKACASFRPTTRKVTYRSTSAALNTFHRRDRRFLTTTSHLLRTSSRNYKNTFYKPCNSIKRYPHSSQCNTNTSIYNYSFHKRSLHVYSQNLQHYSAGVEVISNAKPKPIRSPKQVLLTKELSRYSSDVANNLPVDIAGFSSVSAHTGTNANVFAALGELGSSLKIPNPHMAIIGCGYNPITAREDSVALLVNGNVSNLNYGIAYVARNDNTPYNFNWNGIGVNNNNNKGTVAIYPRPKNMENYEFIVFAEFGLNGKDYRIGFKNSLTANESDGLANYGDSKYRGETTFFMKQLSNLIDNGLGGINGKNRKFDLVAGDFEHGPPMIGNPIYQQVWYWSPGITSSNGKRLDWFVSKKQLKQRKEFGGGIAKARMSPNNTSFMESPTGTDHKGIGIDIV